MECCISNDYVTKTLTASYLNKNSFFQESYIAKHDRLGAKILLKWTNYQTCKDMPDVSEGEMQIIDD